MDDRHEDGPRSVTSDQGSHARALDAMTQAVKHSAELFVLCGADGSIVYANPAAYRTFGVPEDSALGTSVFTYVHPNDLAPVRSEFDRMVTTPGLSVGGTVRYVSANDTLRWLEIVATNCLEDSPVSAVVVNGHDITRRRELETELLDQSLHDALTGLPNRALFLERAEQVRKSARKVGLPANVLFIDLDNFKTINDGLGHTAGDDLLVAVARRLRTAIRRNDITCRFGGDEFVVLLNPNPDDVTGVHVARRIHDVLSVPFKINGRLISVTASIGVASGDAESVEDLVRDADIAMYQAKAGGKNQTVSFASHMQILASDRLQLEIDLHHAIKNGEFAVLYQPIIDLRDRSISGVEALVRWDHPTRGRLAPIDFIPFAEEVGLIVDIGRIVLRAACTAAKAWQIEGAPLTLSVNLSARQLSSPSLLDDVRQILDETGFDPSALVLEVTETTIMRDTDGAVAHLTALKALGVRLAIDDFGTGYSSLSYLRKIPVDILKIDRSFVSDLQHSSEAVAIVHSLIELGNTLELELIAEGVELESQVEALEAQRCQTAQGFLFARPMAPEDLVHFLARTPSSGRAARR